MTMDREKREPSAYPQAGVASTCRSYGEYMDMFALDEEDLRGGAVLDVAGGASEFTARLREKGIEAAAADPFYEGAAEAVIAAAAEEIRVSSLKIESLKDVYDWSYYGSPSRHRSIRESSWARFADDFRREDAGRYYVAAKLPELPFEDGRFRTVLCSHFLFLYADSFGYEFHREAVEELLRVTEDGGEVRIYPLVTLKWELSPFVRDIMESVKGIAEAELIDGKLPFTPVASPVLRLRKRQKNQV